MPGMTLSEEQALIRYADYLMYEQNHEDSRFPVSCHFEGELLRRKVELGVPGEGSLEWKDGEGVLVNRACLSRQLLFPPLFILPHSFMPVTPAPS